MRGRPAEIGWQDLAPSAVGVGVCVTLLCAVANADPAAAEMLALLFGLLGLAVTVGASPHEGIAPSAEQTREQQTAWHEYDGAFRGL